MKTGRSSKGFAMLFSVLLSSLLISIGLSIFNISLKEVDVSSSARDSQIAYYAADSARECAVYWDIKKGAFPACVDGLGSSCNQYNIEIGASDPINVKCGGNNIEIFNHGELGIRTEASMDDFFLYSTTSPKEPRADISIVKTYNSEEQAVETNIETRGHNTGIKGRRIERGIDFNYVQ